MHNNQAKTFTNVLTSKWPKESCPGIKVCPERTRQDEIFGRVHYHIALSVLIGKGKSFEMCPTVFEERENNLSEDYSLLTRLPDYSNSQ